MNFTVSTALETTDGRLWFATDNGLARIDPAHLQTNNIPPPVTITSIVAERAYSPTANLRFAVGTKKIQVRYTALSLAIPERVTFRYKLEGVDEQWQNAGSRREAFYTNLHPGNYTFRVKAANNDGVWNEAGVGLAFEIPPAFFQTEWFLALCIALGAALLWAAYLFRLRQVAGRLQRLHDERMDERIRIARELHDTLLQGFLSASMRLHLASDQLSDDSPAKPIITDVIDLVSEVNEQGRQAVQGLRLPERRESLEEAFGRTKHELGEQRQIGFRVLVEGKSRALHPLIRDEIYRIGREALVNAFRHSEARNIEVELEYLDKRLRLHVRDDGRGIDPGEIETRRDEHWGLAGMQERAQKIGARLSVSSRAGAGSEIELSVPARVAYQPRT
jgi:signal transduction histidine kinase